MCVVSSAGRRKQQKLINDATSIWWHCNMNFYEHIQYMKNESDDPTIQRDMWRIMHANVTFLLLRSRVSLSSIASYYFLYSGVLHYRIRAVCDVGCPIIPTSRISVKLHANFEFRMFIDHESFKHLLEFPRKFGLRCDLWHANSICSSTIYVHMTCEKPIRFPFVHTSSRFKQTSCVDAFQLRPFPKYPTE